MKSIHTILLWAGMFTTSALNAQGHLDAALQAYIEMKNALVTGDGKTASQQAGTFLKALDAVPISKLSAQQSKTWQQKLPTLKSHAKHIMDTQDVAHQRAMLNDLSVTFFEVLKVIKPAQQKVYYQYCPMKKTYWLSEEADIRNPYYGNQMLSCGKVVDTLE
jgi:hypothetical protein